MSFDDFKVVIGCFVGLVSALGISGLLFLAMSSGTEPQPRHATLRIVPPPKKVD